MSTAVPQEILDALTDVDMPKLPPEAGPSGSTRLAGIAVPVYRAGCVVVGSGAAGLRAAVEMKRRADDVVIMSQSAWGGTSACSGSDKQTLHTANTADQGDNYRAMARAIRSGGAMDEDTAYAEAVGSSRMMASLQFLGLPLPQDPLGGTLRYQTDHDEVGRATSCGPRTSRLMVKVLAEEAIRLAVPFYNQTTAVKILTEGEGADRHVVGILAMRAGGRTEENPLGIALYATDVIVLAAGGPGELYRDSVYPNGCFGSLGLALEAGVELVNLTESQFGIGTRREGFPWNLSGTYVQAIPHIYSLDADGVEHHFLAQYYRSTQELASNVFRKGYQWPFHATRMLDFGSSLVDLAIASETAAGRRVFMDFNRNPLPVPGDQPFSLERLDEDVRLYLGKAGAGQDMPIDRLKHMNPLAIELYRRYKIDIAAEPLEFAVNNQHMNGGVMVDTWGRSNLAGCYAVGEAAGTHGVTRPGGAALNAGQVFGTRAAEHISASGIAKRAAAGEISAIAEADITKLLAALRAESPLIVKSIRSEVQARMSEKAGIICDQESVGQALMEARKLNADIRAEGVAYGRAAEAVRGVQWRHMALASEAVLTALDFFIRNGGGSRGARAICDAEGESLPHANAGPLEEYRFRRESDTHRHEQIVVRLEGDEIRLSTRANRTLDEDAKSFFERDWPAWLTGRIYDLGADE
ncbi:succinate dehydrogenase/fumarate reductase flavoprotein subunit [Rhizobium leguminosarum]|uniref:Succinate dehydrogenase/fumarate reductase flavoprotein subunit n=1 Tax=Rhizobium leguminosarum TaxID=384 RepID=A0A7Z0DV16_RHILE|nr:FAD-binding protein [Rhizobium leguminosarum]NYJ09819.1 succinate dehydrogenase/fumarate reductase flavoprotein subunit [Rhizobium leguminosarum]